MGTIETIKKESFLQSDELKKFINFLGEKYNEKNGINLQKELDEYLWDGKDFEITYSMFENMRRDFKNALSTNDEPIVFGLCEKILNWGGVGVATKNIKRIDKLREEKKFISTLQLANEIIKSNKIDIDNIIIPSNSGFSKIYACLNDRFIIYDSRVAAMMCFLVKKCFSDGKNHFSLGKASYQAKGERNPGAEFPLLSGNDKKYLKSNILASWILEAFAEQHPKLNYTTEKLIFAYQTSLFVMGKDLKKIDL